jgi:hypothetical protein
MCQPFFIRSTFREKTMRELSIKDLTLIGGGVGPLGALSGAVVAGATYVGYETINGGGSMTGFIGTVATGAATGFITGPAGAYANTAVAIGGGQLGYYAGMGGAMVQGGLDAAGVNYSGTNYN